MWKSPLIILLLGEETFYFYSLWEKKYHETMDRLPMVLEL